MYARILLPTDGSEITAKAVATAVKLAATVGAEVAVLAVKEPFPYSAITEMQPMPPQEFFDAQERIATKRVQAVVEACRQAGVPCEPVTVEAERAMREFLASHQRDRHGRIDYRAEDLGLDVDDLRRIPGRRGSAVRR